MTVVLGLNGMRGVGTDAGAAIVRDDSCLAAVEEERLLRVKRAPGAPPKLAAREVVEIAGIDPREIDVIAYGWLPEPIGVPRQQARDELLETCRAAGLVIRPDVEVRFVEHHAAHAWSGIAFVPAAERRGRVAALAVDGAGESTSGALFHLKGQELERSWYLELTSSLGIYYEGVSLFLGFGAGQEGKTMGLAAFGRPRELALPELTGSRQQGALPVRPEAYRDMYPYLVRSLAARLERELGEGLCFNDRADVARAAQERVAELLLGYVDEVLDDLDVLVLAGGVALNCTINGVIAERCARRGVSLVIPPPASDAGIALGAAVAAARSPAACHPAGDFGLGRGLAPEQAAARLERAGLEVERAPVEELAKRLVSDDAICGWYDGRAEIGPRALGRRCIVARPDSERLRDLINVRKQRESWRPLAPSLTPREFERSFDGAPSPHMLLAGTIRPEARERLAGVVHVDASCRPQVVGEDGAYQRLLLAMGELTGTEAVLCTSFNRAGEPIVYRLGEALESASAMGLDLLAGDGWCVRNPTAPRREDR